MRAGSSTSPALPYNRLSSNIARQLARRVADIHVVICQVKARVSRARSGERANQQFQDVLCATVCLSASVPALGRTRHPFAVSGSEEPSPKIEFVFSASPETIRREPREGNLLRSVGNMQDLAVCAFCSSCLFRQYFMPPKSCVLPQARSLSVADPRQATM